VQSRKVGNAGKTCRQNRESIEQAETLYKTARIQKSSAPSRTNGRGKRQAVQCRKKMKQRPEFHKRDMKTAVETRENCYRKERAERG